MTEPLPPEVYASYSIGNPFDPVGEGRFTVELKTNDDVVLTHERQRSQRKWVAVAENLLRPAFEAALTTAGFPTMPSVKVSAAGAESFKLSVRDVEGKTNGISGFDSPEYADVGRLFLQIIGQMTGSELLGFMPRMTATYIRDCRPA